MKNNLLAPLVLLLITFTTSCSKIIDLEQWVNKKENEKDKLKWIRENFANPNLGHASLYSSYDDSKNTLFYVNSDFNILYEHNLVTKKIINHTIQNPIYRTVLISSRNGKLYGKSEYGRDIVYEFDFLKKKWINPSKGSGDYESFGHATYYNPIAMTVGFFGGYGFYRMKNFIWEIIPGSGKQWNLISPDIDNSLSKGIARGVKSTTYNKSGSKLYLYGGQGNYSGNQFDQTCNSSITPMPTGDGSYCWLRDLWEYDLKTRKIRNLISPFTEKLPAEGAMAYDEDKDIMYLMGGRKPPFCFPDHAESLYELTLHKTHLKSNIQFQEVKVDNTVLPTNESYKSLVVSVLYFDHKLQMLIWVNSKGIFLLKLSK